MKKDGKKGLGRGFSSLIPEDIIQEEFDTTYEQDKQLSTTKQILIKQVLPNPNQPRRKFIQETLDELTESIKEHGVLQPIVVVRDGSNFQIVAGERRWRAAKQAGLLKVPAIVRDFDDQSRLEIALIENVQREDLSPLEMATAYLKLQNQFNMTMAQIAKRVGKASSTVSNVKRLLKLPNPAKRALNELKISEQHARAILSLDGEPQKQQELLDHILRYNWTATRAEQFVTAYKSGATTPTEAVRRTEVVTKETKAISGHIKAPVKIRRMAKGGRIIIQFKDDKDFTRISKLLSK